MIARRKQVTEKMTMTDFNSMDKLNKIEDAENKQLTELNERLKFKLNEKKWLNGYVPF